ncbi:alpha/beta fold hydrolase [Nakamurella silvestris]|nr:alpha/beta fold hydrolase [Nakamurella silvestris]
MAASSNGKESGQGQGGNAFRRALDTVRRTRGRRITAVAVAAVLVLAIAVAVWPSNTQKPVNTEVVSLPVPGGAGEDTTIDIDTTVYLPTTLPAPAIILAHGLGGTKDSVKDDAEDLARSGYLVLAYSARGFGASGGHIHLDSLDYEAKDAVALVDYLSTRSDVISDGPGDPRVGVMGGSYGGAVSLMLAGLDRRVDAAVPLITWNSLGDALFPNYATPATDPKTTIAQVPNAADGVFKKYWAAVFMTAITSGSLITSAAAGLDPSAGTGGDSTDGDSTDGGAAAPSTPTTPPVPDLDPAAGVCGRVALDVCAGYVRVAQSGVLDKEMQALLANSSPAAVVGDITAPTLLVQGERDTLFGLDQADANARAIAANGAPVSVLWFSGGHDGGGIDTQTRQSIHSWFDHYLAQKGPAPDLGFRYNIDGSISDTGRVRSRTLQAPGYPGLAVGGTVTEPLNNTTLTLHGGTQPVFNPPGGTPAAISSIPGLGGTASTVLATLGADIPGQSARFSTDPLTQQVLLTGSPSFTLQVTAGPALTAAADTSTGGTDAADQATFFVKVYKVSASGVRTLAGGASPIRVAGLTAGTPVEVPLQLTPVALQIDTGSTIQVVVSTTDQAFSSPNTAASYLLALGAGGVITLPVAGGSNVSTSDIPVAALIGLIILVIIAITWLILGGIVRRHRTDIDPELVDLPLRITGLRKEYPGGVTAVQDVGFEVKAGQVLGLLGPNGAGKTTSLRMVMGLITPSAGEIRVFGHKITPGAPVLSRIGSFVEGSGFLPHLSGKDNLNLYWEATGRPADAAYMEQALAIAGLGKAVERKVRTYSQGMRQRLAIAQAMLGLPDLLILDEPTNGLDPPQIHAMREVLRRYAATGRTVLVSSHLLSEVEQTCTHVVVVNQGRTIASGTVAELVAASGEMTFTVDDPARAAELLRTLPGVDEVAVEDNQVQIDLAGNAPAAAIELLVRAGVAVTTAAPRNRLEDVFLDLVGATSKGTS